MKLNDGLVGALLLLLAFGVLRGSRGFAAVPGQNVGPAVFPTLLALLLASCAVLLMVRAARASDTRPWVIMGDWVRSARHRNAFIVSVGSMAFYVALSPTLGFIICGTTILLAMFSVLEVPRWRALFLAIVVTLAIHTLFYKGLHVPLPWGVLAPVAW